MPATDLPAIDATAQPSTPSMSAEAIAAAAGLIAEARWANALLESLPAALTPQSVADGYAIQDQIRARWGQPVAGWKTGATARAVQAKFGVAEPFCGPIFAANVHADADGTGARIPAAGYPYRLIECEFAFRFARDLPARSQPYARADVVAAVAAVIPAIEVVGPRFTTFPFGRAPLAIADCGVNACLVLGREVAGHDLATLPAHGVRLAVDGRPRAEGAGRDVLGDPLVSLVWTVQHLSRRGIGISAGQLVSTGTTTGIVHLEPGEVAIADFGTLGKVGLSFTGAPHPSRLPPPA
jgi:2-keto-4-pentenoate hydratase